MFKRKQKMGSIHFIVRQQGAPDVRGEVNWFEEMDHQEKSALQSRVKCWFNAEDERLDSVSNYKNGLSTSIQLGPIVFDIDSKDMKSLCKTMRRRNAEVEQMILNSVVDRLKRKESESPEEIHVSNFNEVYQDAKFIPFTKIWEQQRKDQHEKRTSIEKVKYYGWRASNEFKWRAGALIYRIIKGPQNYVLGISDPITEAVKTRALYQFVIGSFGAVLISLLLVFKIYPIFFSWPVIKGELGWKGPFIIMMIAVIGWALREEKILNEQCENEGEQNLKEDPLQDRVKVELDRLRFFHFPDHWRGKLWKLLGYAAISLGTYYIAAHATINVSVKILGN